MGLRRGRGMTPVPWHLLFPFLAAIVFAAGNFSLKRALQLGSGPIRALALTNLTIAAVFAPIGSLGQAPHWGDAWKAGLAGAAYFLGQVLNVSALRLGDASLVTPMMGAKVVFVALFAHELLGLPMSVGQRVAAALTTVGVLIIGAPDVRSGPRLVKVLGLALASAACFALCDLAIQGWAGAFGAQAYAGIMFGTVGVASTVVWPVRERHWPFDRTRRRVAERWLWAAIAFTALQSLFMTIAISVWGDATRVNVVYSLRALWGVGLVWLLGDRFGSGERRRAGRRRMTFRAVGALTLVVAVFLAVAN